MIRLSLLAFLATSLLVAGQEPTPAPNRPTATNDDPTEAAANRWIVKTECRMVLMPQAPALQIVSALTAREKSDSGWNEVEKAIASGGAKLVTALLGQCTDGKKVVSEASEQMPYPSEFDPPKLPDRIPEGNAAEVLKLWPAVSITPTAFEVRNIGQSFELEPEVSPDGSLIRCRIVAQDVRFLRWQKYECGKLANGEKLSTEQPIFHVMRTSTDVTVVNGQALLIGIHKAPVAEDGYELFLIRVRAERSAAK